MKQVTEAAIWQVLQEIKDPEIPVVSLVEMGIVREVVVDGDAVTVRITPTFAGCPALAVMQREIYQRLTALGVKNVKVETVLHPPWTSDWINDAGRAKLRAFGLAPPVKHGGNIELILGEEAICPRCRSTNTTLKSSFGSTLCRMIYVCNDCREPFEQFKAI